MPRCFLASLISALALFASATATRAADSDAPPTAAAAPQFTAAAAPPSPAPSPPDIPRAEVQQQVIALQAGLAQLTSRFEGGGCAQLQRQIDQQRGVLLGLQAILQPKQQAPGGQP